ncbi:MAG: hypothetical protein R3179_03535 [Sedimenticolaceae bacterium]|nr:hypothetical protein [Sedimenticolaceae bacterium]
MDRKQENILPIHIDHLPSVRKELVGLFIDNHPEHGPAGPTPHGSRRGAGELRGIDDRFRLTITSDVMPRDCRIFHMELPAFETGTLGFCLAEYFNNSR